MERTVLVVSRHSPRLQQWALREPPSCFVFPQPVCPRQGPWHLLQQHGGAGAEKGDQHGALAPGEAQLRVLHPVCVQESAAASELTTVPEAPDLTERGCVSLGSSAGRVKPQELGTANAC